MHDERLLWALAPCGIDCKRCVRRDGGDIEKLATALTEALRGFESRVPLFKQIMPALEHYDGFTEVLAVLASGTCQGCRSGDVQFPPCAAKTCHKEQQVDFCFECAEYPCTRNSFPEPLATLWRTRNDRMAEAGVETYYEEQKKLPRY